MKIALSLEVSDEQRNALAQQLTGKAIKRLATREEIRTYVEGTLGALSAGDETASPSSADEEATRLRAAGKSESYIRGWIAAGKKP